MASQAIQRWRKRLAEGELAYDKYDPEYSDTDRAGIEGCREIRRAFETAAEVLSSRHARVWQTANELIKDMMKNDYVVLWVD